MQALPSWFIATQARHPLHWRKRTGCRRKGITSDADLGTYSAFRCGTQGVGSQAGWDGLGYITP